MAYIGNKVDGGLADGNAVVSGTLDVSNNVTLSADVTIGDDLVLTDDLFFGTDGTVINFGADNDVTLTHVHDTGILLNSSKQLQFGDSGTYIHQSADGVLDLVSDTEIEINATTIDMNGAVDISGSITGTTATLTTADNSTQLKLVSTDTDASVGPKLDLHRNSANPAADDIIGLIRFMGEDSASNEQEYAKIRAHIIDPTSGSEDTKFVIQTQTGGAGFERLMFSPTETNFNDDGGAIDFRIESDNSTHMLFVDASADAIGIRKNDPSFGLDVGVPMRIITADNTSQLVLESTDADANKGPVLDFFRNSASPNDSDDIGRINFQGNDEGGNATTYAKIETSISDSSDGTEDANLFISSLVDGTSVQRIGIYRTGTIINQDSADLDFRVEGNGDTHLLFVDAGEDRVSIGTSDVTTAAQEGKLKVRNDVDYSSTEFEDNATLMLQNENNNNSASIVLHSNNSSGSSKRAGIVGGNINSNITGLGFYGDIGNIDSSTTPHVVLRSDGKLGIGTTNDSVATQNTDQGVMISPSGRLFATGDGHHDFNRQNDGEIIRFRSAASLEGTISVSGSTVSYNGFSGTHETSGIANNVAVGTICSTIDELDTYAEGQLKAGQTRADHAKIKVSDTEGDKRVYGVLQSYSEDGKPLVASVGIGSIRVTGACEGGDLLESNGDGTAKVQSDDIIRSKTIGKVTIGNSSEKVKLVSCVLYCG